MIRRLWVWTVAVSSTSLKVMTVSRSGAVGLNRVPFVSAGKCRRTECPKLG